MTSSIAAQTLLVMVAATLLGPGTTYSAQESRIIVRSGEWELVGDLVIADDETRQPAVLMLNQAAGDLPALQAPRRGAC